MWLAVSCDRGKGHVAHTPIVNTVHFQQLHIVKTGRITLLLAVGFARVAIKELVLSGVPDRTPPGK